MDGVLGAAQQVGKAALVMLGLIGLSIVGEMFGVARGVDSSMIALCTMGLAPLVLILLFRWLTYRVLWKVRNRLIMTYLLMGLAPVVMFATLALGVAWVLAGQYATDIGLSQLNQGLTRLRDQAGGAIVFGSQGAAQMAQRTAISSAVSSKKHSTDDSDDTSQTGSMSAAEGEDATPISLMEWTGKAWTPLDAAAAKAAGSRGGPLTSVPLPEWVHPGFQGIVESDRLLYLCTEVSAPRNGKTVVVLASRALTRDELNMMAKGMGRILVSQGYSKLAADKDDDGTRSTRWGTTRSINVVGPDALMKGGDFNGVSSVPLEKVTHPYLDPPIWFTASLPVTEWETGKSVSAMIAVISRPTLLYALLFASSVKVGKVVWGILIGVATFFAMLEFFALAMATTLSWSITRSVAELYRGTREIDAGHLEHRIPVKRKDQLAALATSFNGMAASVSELLVQQREKERLLNELAIAQEVQTTLFPKSPAVMGTLEVHGTCLPARTVGGDYFDFIFGYGPGYAVDGGPGGHVTLALGDISGKGISAALLMSGLHSADRAFSAAVGQEGGAGPSPAMLLKLLNDHLYRSTQSARYATLFLATYDPATRRLTYSNGGHLPPLVISKDGSVQKLEVGGAVVGLLAGMEYEEATVELQQGDLFVAYTDGLTEPEKNGEDFGEQRLMEFVRARRSEPLTVLAANTLQAVKAWIGNQEQPDDMTIVLARQG